jgi:c-di-GMP-binding flagellar brake protein YcgR
VEKERPAENPRTPAVSGLSPETICAGDFLEVRVVNDAERVLGHSWVERVEENRIIVTWPRDLQDAEVPARHGQTLELTFVCTDTAYTLSAIVENRIEDRIPRLVLRPLSLPVRTQRRQFFRIRCSVPLEVSSVAEGVNGWSVIDPPSLIHFKCRTYDLSGSGISFRHTEFVPSGVYVEARINLGELPLVRAICRVLDSRQDISEKHKSMFAVRLHIVQISEADRSRIVRHCFRVQQADLTR